MVDVFNRFIRLRDRNRPCISCALNRVEHAGHYWKTSQYPQPSMRFNEKNVNGQCFNCNMNLEGNRQGYREGLIRKYGESVLEELDIQRSLPMTTWMTFEYEAMIKHYREKVKILEKQL